MRLRYKVYPYKMGSQSGKFIARGLGALRIYPDGRSRYRYRSGDLIINWGTTYLPDIPLDRVLNDPERVFWVSNKVRFFRIHRVGGLPFNTVPYFFSLGAARDWLESAGEPPRAVVARTLTRSTGGRGAIYCEDSQSLPEASLYTGYVKKTAEYRVHLGVLPSGEVRILHTQEKRRRRGQEIDNKIRNSSNGWVYCLEDVSPPSSVYEEARKALLVYGLDFGAVDIIHNQYYGSFVLEINTAPGVEGTTLQRYLEYFRDFKEEVEEEL